MDPRFFRLERIGNGGSGISTSRESVLQARVGVVGHLFGESDPLSVGIGQLSFVSGQLLVVKQKCFFADNGLLPGDHEPVPRPGMPCRNGTAMELIPPVAGKLMAEVVVVKSDCQGREDLSF